LVPPRNSANPAPNVTGSQSHDDVPGPSFLLQDASNLRQPRRVYGGSHLIDIRDELRYRDSLDRLLAGGVDIANKDQIGGGKALRIGFLEKLCASISVRLEDRDNSLHVA